jgi:hypothetical protein
MDLRQIFLQCYRAFVRTGFYTGPAGIAARRANAGHNGALFQRFAREVHKLGARYQCQNMARAFLHAHTAAIAYVAVNHGQLIRADPYRVLRTDFDAVPVPKTAVFAFLAPAEKEMIEPAIGRARIDKTVTRLIPAAAAGNADLLVHKELYQYRRQGQYH